MSIVTEDNLGKCNGINLMCCHGCNQWYMVASSEDYEHHICSCGAESYTEDWIKAHPEHKDYSAYVRWKEAHPNG